MHVSNRKLALAGIAGTVTYAIADLFLYIGADILNEDRTKLLSIPEWRLMASMWIAALGSLLMLMGYISLARLFAKAFPKTGKYLILPALMCFGGIMYMHFTLGVYEPLTYASAMKAGIPNKQIQELLTNSMNYLNPLTMTLVVLGYSTQIVLITGILTGRFNLRKRTAAYIYGGAAVVILAVILISKLTGEWGFTGSLESLFEMTFFLPGYIHFTKLEKENTTQ